MMMNWLKRVKFFVQSMLSRVQLLFKTKEVVYTTKLILIFILTCFFFSEDYYILGSCCIISPPQLFGRVTQLLDQKQKFSQNSE